MALTTKTFESKEGNFELDSRVYGEPMQVKKKNRCDLLKFLCSGEKLQLHFALTEVRKAGHKRSHIAGCYNNPIVKSQKHALTLLLMRHREVNEFYLFCAG